MNSSKLMNSKILYKKPRKLEVFEKISDVDQFLEKAEKSDIIADKVTPISRTNKEIFISLSDVSTDESDNEIIKVSKKEELPKQLSKSVKPDTVDNKHKFANLLNSLDYLTNPPLCIIKQGADYLRFNARDPESDDSSSDSSDSSQDAIIPLDNGDCFILDGGINMPGEGKAIDGGPVEKVKNKRKRKSQKRFPDNPELRNEPRMFKYWSQRYDLFERFDMGIKLDKESWFSVTPEYIAKEHAGLCNENDVVVDGFCGAGGNTIQFGYRCKKVYAVDLDPLKVRLTEHNCGVYGVEPGKVVCLQEDFYRVCGEWSGGSGVLAKPDIGVVFLSPPWGGQDYLMSAEDTKGPFDLAGMGMAKMMASARALGPRLIIVFLPRNTDQAQLRLYAADTDTLDILKHGAHYNSHQTAAKVKAVTAVYRLR